VLAQQPIRRSYVCQAAKGTEWEAAAPSYRRRSACQGALDAAANVAVGLALEGALGFVCPGSGVASDAGDRDGVQRPVQGAVAAAVEAVPGALTSTVFQACDSGQ
jgi:hypothetical protein